MSMIVIATIAVVSVATMPVASAESPAATATPDGAVVYYFHGNVRCATCKKIEAYTDDAVSQEFSQELQNGALSWRVVNVEEPQNRHFIQDFQLVTKSVVLAEYRDGNVVRWKNLDKVWQLVRNQDAFAAYIRDETSAFLGGS